MQNYKDFSNNTTTEIRNFYMPIDKKLDNTIDKGCTMVGTGNTIFSSAEQMIFNDRNKSQFVYVQIEEGGRNIIQIAKLKKINTQKAAKFLRSFLIIIRP